MSEELKNVETVAPTASEDREYTPEELEEFREFAEEHSASAHAKREVEFILNKLKEGYENEDDIDFCYNKDIYEAALKMVNFYLTEIGPSGYAHSRIIPIFNRLVDGEPLMPLTGEDVEWDSRMTYKNEDGSEVYQNKRCSAVFKKVFPDGKVEYSYNDYILKQEIEHLGANWSGYTPDSVLACLNKEDVITMPFMPNGNRFIIYTSEYTTDENGQYSVTPGEYNTVVYLYAHDKKTNKNYPIFKLFREGSHDLIENPYMEQLATRPCKEVFGFTYCGGDCDKCENAKDHTIPGYLEDAKEFGHEELLKKVVDTSINLYVHS